MRGRDKKPRAKDGEPLAWVRAALASDTDDCLIYPFALQPNGYGSLPVGRGQMARVHRYVCIKAHGEPPSPKHEAAHNCNNRSCGNPKHIRWATPKENHADQVVHGTINRGERHGQVKLTKEIVLAARQSGRGAAVLAREHGVSQATMNDALTGRTWAWL